VLFGQMEIQFFQILSPIKKLKIFISTYLMDIGQIEENMLIMNIVILKLK